MFNNILSSLFQIDLIEQILMNFLWVDDLFSLSHASSFFYQRIHAFNFNFSCHLNHAFSFTGRRFDDFSFYNTEIPCQLVKNEENETKIDIKIEKNIKMIKNIDFLSYFSLLFLILRVTSWPFLPSITTEKDEIQEYFIDLTQELDPTLKTQENNIKFSDNNRKKQENIIKKLKNDLFYFQNSSLLRPLSSLTMSMSEFHQKISQQKYMYCFAYQGKKIGNNRSIVLNDYFPPVFNPKSRRFTQDSLILPSKIAYPSPFLKTTVDPLTNKSLLSFSQMAYYEVTIYGIKEPHDHVVSQSDRIRARGGRNLNPPHNDEDDEAENLGGWTTPCVSIGLARQEFNIYKSLPGMFLANFSLI